MLSEALLPNDTAKLGAYATAVATRLTASGERAYSYHTIGSGADGIPDVDPVAASAFTDCSGWVAFALNSVAPLHEAVAAAHRTESKFNQGEVSTSDGGKVLLAEATDWGWARAEVLTDLFERANGANGFMKVADFADLRAGDVIAYSLGIYSDPTGNPKENPGLVATGDTGHTMVVTGAPVHVTDKAVLAKHANLSSDVVAVYAVPVVDSSDLRHFDSPQADDRNYVVPSDDPRTGEHGDKGGGVGTGSMWFGVNAAGQPVQFCFGACDGWQPPPGGDACTIAAARLTDTIDLSETDLQDGKLVVRVYPKANPILGGVDYAVSEHLTGEGGIEVTGGGTLTLNSGNTFKGQVEVNEGTILAIDADDALGAAANRLILDDGATLRICAPLTLEHGVSVITGTAVFDLAGSPVRVTGALSVAPGATLALTSSGTGGELELDDEVQPAGTILVGGSIALTLTSTGGAPGTIALQDGATLNVHASSTLHRLLVIGKADVSVSDGAILTLSGETGPALNAKGIGVLQVSGGGSLVVGTGSAAMAELPTGTTLYTGTLEQFDKQTLAGFKAGDAIDIAGLLATAGSNGVTVGVSATYDNASGVLTIAQGDAMATVQLTSGLELTVDGSPEVFTARTDGSGGTLVQLTASTDRQASNTTETTAMIPATADADCPLLAFTDTSTGQHGTVKMDVSGAGSPDYLRWQHVATTSDNMAFAAQASDVFIHGGSGNDAIVACSGRNVIDGGAGSNFMVGGTGNDTFFTDARAPGAAWNTISNFHTGDAATLWGFDPAVSSYYWEDDLAGADGYKGATLRADIAGSQGRAGDGIDVSITFAGMSVEQAKSMVHTTGDIQGGAVKYLYIFNQGV